MIDKSNSTSASDAQWKEFHEARAEVRKVGLDSVKAFRVWMKEGNRPASIPSNPQKIYADQWQGWADWLGFAPREFHEAREYARSLGIEKRDQWVEHLRMNDVPRDIPKWPQNAYKDSGWISWQDWLGREDGFRFRPFEEARAFIRSRKLKSRREWTAFSQSEDRPKDIPSDPSLVYQGKWSGFADWLGTSNYWNHAAIVAFVKSLRNCVAELEPAEVFSILMNRGLLGKRFPTNSNASILKSLGEVCSDTDPKHAVENVLMALETNGDTLDSEASGDEVDSIESLSDDVLKVPTRLPSLTSMNDLHLPDRLANEGVIEDEELLDFLVNNRVAMLWQRALEGSPESLLEELREQRGGHYLEMIRERFALEYSGANSLEIPRGYAFKVNGELQPPNLMQRLTAYRILRDKRFVNFSGTGAGKTLAAILASRHANSHVTIIVAVNATIEHWETVIREAFPNARVHTKDVASFVPDSSMPNYFILNFESFQQVWSDAFFEDLTSMTKIDFVILDEIQLVRQRTERHESKRRALVRSLVEQASLQNPDLRVLGMSATPVINNLHEAKTLLELVTGKSFDELATKSTVENAIRVHQKLILNGIRYRPRYDMTVETSHREIEGMDLLPDLKQVKPRDLLGLEQVLLKKKLPEIANELQPGTMIYTQFVSGIVEPVQAMCQQLGFSIGTFTGEDKTGLKPFIDGELDVLIGSSTVGTGIDGLQRRCNRLIFLALPWTAAEYEQIVGRLYRQGTRFDHVKIIVPQIVLRGTNGKAWSWDKLRWDRIQWKRSLADAAVDGIVPQGNLPSKEEMQAKSLQALSEWEAKIDKAEFVAS